MEVLDEGDFIFMSEHLESLFVLLPVFEITKIPFFFANLAASIVF